MKTRRRAVKDGETSMGAGAHFEASAAPVFPPVAALEKYRGHVAHLDLPEEQKTALLQAVWQIMGSFVDRAFGDDPVQLARTSVDRSSPGDASEGRPVLDSSATKQTPDKARLARAFAPSAAARRRKETP